MPPTGNFKLPKWQSGGTLFFRVGCEGGSILQRSTEMSRSALPAFLSARKRGLPRFPHATFRQIGARVLRFARSDQGGQMVRLRKVCGLLRYCRWRQVRPCGLCRLCARRHAYTRQFRPLSYAANIPYCATDSIKELGPAKPDGTGALRTMRGSGVGGAFSITTKNRNIRRVTHEMDFNDLPALRQSVLDRLRAGRRRAVPQDGPIGGTRLVAQSFDALSARLQQQDEQIRQLQWQVNGCSSSNRARRSFRRPSGREAARLPRRPASARRAAEVGSDMTIKANFWNGEGLMFATPNKDFTFHLGAWMQWDNVWWNQSPSLKELDLRHPLGRRLLAAHPHRHGRHVLGNVRVPL